MAERVRASSITLLPAEADDDVAYIVDQVITRQSMTQNAGLIELNRRLVAAGLSPTTSSSFNRLIVRFRETGIPPRYRRHGQAEAPESLTSAALVALIDARIDLALRKAAAE